MLLGGLLAIPSLCFGATESAQTRAMVRHYATHYNVPQELISALIDVESAWNPHAVSDKGAMGLMQLMPETARHFWRPQSPRSGTEHRCRHSLCHHADAGVSWRSAAGRGGLQRGRPLGWQEAASLPQFRCRRIRGIGTAPLRATNRSTFEGRATMKQRLIFAPLGLLLPCRFMHRTQQRRHASRL